MNCENLQLELPLYIDDVLSEDERLLIEKHLPTCPLCRQKLSEYKALRNDLRMVSRPVLPNDLLNSIRSAVANEINQPTIQIGTEERLSFTEKLAHWLLPYSIGTVAASILTFVLLTTLMTTNDATSNIVRTNDKPRESSILLAKSTPTDNINLTLPEDYQQINIPNYTPEVNPSGALMALTKSIFVGDIKDDEVVIIANVFNNGLAKIDGYVEPPSNEETIKEIQKAFNANPENAPFLPTKNSTKSNSTRVILKIQRVDVIDTTKK